MQLQVYCHPVYMQREACTDATIKHTRIKYTRITHEWLHKSEFDVLDSNKLTVWLFLAINKISSAFKTQLKLENIQIKSAGSAESKSV